MVSHLLVVGVGNSDNQGPAGSCKRLNKERGGGDRPINGEIGTPPQSHVSLTPPSLTGYDFKEADRDGGGGLLPYG